MKSSVGFMGQIYKPLVQGFTPSSELRTDRFMAGAGVSPVDYTAKNVIRDAATTAQSEGE